MSQAIIIDNGSGTCKVGFGGEDDPKAKVKSVIGNDEGNCLIGDDAQCRRDTLALGHPIKRGMVTNWDDMEKIWQHAFSNELGVSTEEHPVLLTEPCLNTNANREKMAEIMFETFKCPAIYVGTQAFFAVIGNGQTTGVVVECGHGLTDTVPIYEGATLSHAISRLDIAGADLTDYMNKLLTEKGYSFGNAADQEAVCDMKEKHAYIAFDFEDELEMTEGGNRVAQHYTLPDGQVVTLASERFRCPESLFQPSLAGIDAPGIHAALFDSISKCDSELQKDLFTSIVLSGGSTMFNGIQDRLKKELDAMADPTQKIRLKHYNRATVVWHGASIQTCLDTFKRDWMSKWDYDEGGPATIHHRFF